MRNMLIPRYCYYRGNLASSCAILFLVSGLLGDVVVSPSDLGPEGREFDLTLTVPLSTQVYKWKPGNCFGDNLTKCWEVTCDGLVSHPGGVEILLVASYYRNRR